MGKKLQFSAAALRGMRRPSQPVTGPLTRQREAARPAASGEPGKWAALMAMPLMRVCLFTLGGGMLVGLAAWALGRGDFGFGFFVGALMALAGLFTLKAVTSKVFEMGKASGVWWFQGMNIARWFLLAVVYYLLLKISIACLLGAVASYVWFLAVLAWLGLRGAKEGVASAPADPGAETK